MNEDYKKLIGKERSIREIYSLIPNKWVCFVNCAKKMVQPLGL